mgnify:CR=1 FL=1
MSDNIFAPKMPLEFDNSLGYRNVDDLKELVRFHLTNLLLTNPGERIMMPNYGVVLRRVLFEQQGSSAVTGLRQKIYKNFKKFRC